MSRKPIPKKIREKVYEKYDGHCAYCGKKLAPREMRVDHIVPVYDGGENDIENLNPSCHDCNWVKGAASADNIKNSVENYYLRTLRKDIRYRMLLAYGFIQETPHKVAFYYEKKGEEE